MKKEYIIPANKVVSLRTAGFIATSPANSYGDNQGNIRFSSTEVSANDAD